MRTAPWIMVALLLAATAFPINPFNIFILFLLLFKWRKKKNGNAINKDGGFGPVQFSPLIHTPFYFFKFGFGLRRNRNAFSGKDSTIRNAFLSGKNVYERTYFLGAIANTPRHSLLINENTHCVPFYCNEAYDSFMYIYVILCSHFYSPTLK